MPSHPQKALFQIGGYWIAKEPKRDGYWYFFRDRDAGHVRRRKLGSSDLEEAKIELARIVLTSAPKHEGALVSAVMLAYHEGHSDKIRSAGMARTATRKALSYFGETVTVSDLTDSSMNKFASRLILDGASPAYVQRIVNVLAAGFRYSKLPVDWKLRLPQAAPRRVPIPTDEEVRKLFAAKPIESMKRWMILSLATGARPEAVLELCPSQRRDGLLYLNPPERSQTKKYRPVVREPAYLTPWLDLWGTKGDRYVGYHSQSAVRSALKRLIGKSGVNVAAYSFRHKVATILRQAKRQGVTEDDIATQLGHRRPNLKVTSGYGEYDPDYLDTAASALSAWLSRNCPAKPRQK